VSNTRGKGVHHQKNKFCTQKEASLPQGVATRILASEGCQERKGLSVKEGLRNIRSSVVPGLPSSWEKPTEGEPTKEKSIT